MNRSLPHILIAEQESWSELATRMIRRSILFCLGRSARCSVMLTGGSTARRLYQYWAETGPWDHASMEYFFGDERCVPPDHPESNYGMTMKSLFASVLPHKCSIHRMEAEDPDPDSAARRYEAVIPESPDILLLSVGHDGHVASLFPFSSGLNEMSRSVIPVTGPKPPARRLTITPKVLTSAKTIYLLARGGEKGLILANALKQPHDVETLPVRLVLNATWILDEAAGITFRDIKQETGRKQ